MHPSRAPSSHPSSAAWLPCPTSAASTTATSDERRRPGRSLFPPAAKSKRNIHSRRFCRRQCYQRPLTVSSLHPQHDGDRKSTRLNSSHSQISYAVFCLKKKKNEQ